MKASNVIFTTNNAQENLLVIVAEEVKSFVGVIVPGDVLCYFIEIKCANPVIVKGGNKFQIPMIGKREYLPERDKAIDAFFHMSDLHFICPVTMFYLAVVFKKGDIVCGGFYSQDDARFIV
ncbi:MAG: hypothetical protein HRF42_09640 [Candidatus Brocadia sp.]